MTLALDKKVVTYPSIKPTQQQQINDGFEIFHNKDFYCGEIKKLEKDTCCFNHIVGLPQKDGISHPLYDYEKELFDAYNNHKHVWILKASGLGVSEFYLRLMLWLAVRNKRYDRCQFCIIVGPRFDLARKLVRRMKNIIRDFITVKPETDNNTEIEINGVQIQAYPSHNIDSYRSLEAIKFILLDEADMFRKSEYEDVRTVTERNIGKSQPWIVMISTPRRPDGLMKSIQDEQDSIYHKFYFNYEVGLGKIYTEKDIQEAKRSPSFEQEYNLKYMGKIGNVYSQLSINTAVERGEQYNPDFINKLTPKIMAIDEGFSSSKFGIVIGQWTAGQLQIMHEEELDHPLFEEAIEHIFRLREKYGNVLNIAFDASRPELGRTLKKRIGERHDWQYIQDKVIYCKKHRFAKIEDMMIVVPVLFTQESKSDMTYHSRKLLDDPKGRISINKRFDKIITALKAAQFDNEGKLDKEESPYNDLLDAFQMLAYTAVKYPEDENKK